MLQKEKERERERERIVVGRLATMVLATGGDDERGLQYCMRKRNKRVVTSLVGEKEEVVWIGILIAPSSTTVLLYQVHIIRGRREKLDDDNDNDNDNDEWQTNKEEQEKKE